MSEILEARERRSEHIQQLMKEYPHKSVVILKTNVVGAQKNPIHMRFICAFFNNMVVKTFQHKILLMGKRDSFDGNYCFYVIDEVGTLVKERSIELEEFNRLGRLIDLDVYYKKPISRQDLKCEMRTCLVCDNFAHICARNQTHTQDEIHSKVREIIEDFLTEYITNITIKAIYSELELYPKFGLVSHRDNGCHTDMDYELFVQSTFAIRHQLEAYVKTGFEAEINVQELVRIGQQAEANMFAATGGVNTQKGLIFLLGVFLPVITSAIIRNEDESYVVNHIQQLAKAVVGDYYETLTEDNTASFGDHIYLKHHLKGPRGEAMNGLQIIFEIPTFVHHDDDITFHEYLIEIMSRLDDTTIVHRTSLETMRMVQQDMKKLISSGGYSKQKTEFNTLSERYKTQNISPGGAADMLVLKLIYEEVQYLMRHIG